MSMIRLSSSQEICGNLPSCSWIGVIWYLSVGRSYSGRANVTGAFVPAFVAQPFLQCSQTDLRKPLAEAGDVGLEPFVVKPIEHLVKLFAEDKSHHGHGKLLKSHRLAEHAAEDFGSFGVGQFAAGDLQLQSNKWVGALEGQSHKCADVIGGDCLIFFIAPDRVHQFAFQNSYLDLVDVIVLHEGDGPEHCGG